MLSAVEVDHQSKSFSTRKPSKRVDKFDFSGDFSLLENIDIDARRKKLVELDLSGSYPVLTDVNYEGTFGNLTGKFTGVYQKLSNVNVLCTSCAMQLDFTGQWEKNCTISIHGQKEDLVIKLPENVGLIVKTKTSPTGKVVVRKEGLKSQGWLHILNKVYHNRLVDMSDIVLTFNIEVSEGKIILE